MAYLGGDGTEADPWLIHDQVSFSDYWKHYGTGFWRIVHDIDMSGFGVIGGGVTALYKTIDGAGHSITNCTFPNDPGVNNGGPSAYHLKNITIYVVAGWTGFTRYTQTLSFTNVRVHYEYAGDVGFANASAGNTHFTNCIISGMCTLTGTNANPANCTNLYIACGTTAAVAADAKYTIVDSGNLSDPASYPGLPAEFWTLEAGAVPVTKPAVIDYSYIAYIAGVTTVDGAPESRYVRVYSAVSVNMIGSLVSDDEGKFNIRTTPWKEPVLIIAHDNIGEALKPATAYAIDNVAHPKGGNGYRYVCIQAGTTADPLPDLPWPTDQLTSGDAIFEAKKIRQPIIEGPVTPAPVLPLPVQP